MSLRPPAAFSAPLIFFFQAEDGIRDSSTSRGLGDVYKRQGGGEVEGWRDEETRRMGRAALEDGLGRGSYVVGAQWDEGNMVHAMRRFGGTTVGWRFGDG